MPLLVTAIEISPPVLKETPPRFSPKADPPTAEAGETTLKMLLFCLPSAFYFGFIGST